MIVITVARKPVEGTVASNVLKHRCGALNIDGCRIATDSDDNIYAKNPHTVGTIGAKGIYGEGRPTLYQVGDGRWPANVILSDNAGVLGVFPLSKSCDTPSEARSESKYRPAQGNYQRQGKIYPGEFGSAARFFKVVKE